ncbi:MAG: aminotransferase class V-fold PLP-dependent enzyme [Myxococcales bacterium]|nr:aminotransferase class V-fold PLP-dependent enzyme [Myxococcales bacterium]
MAEPPIYANNAGTSWPKPPGVVEAAAAALDAPPAEGLAAFEAAAAAVCALIGVPTSERLLLTPSCTGALGLALGDLPWQPGDLVLTSALEHHALARAVEKLERERGVEHRALAYRPGATIDLEQARRVLATGRVRLVAVTHASNVTGELLPIAELAALARSHGALVLLDAAQTLGVIDLDVQELGVDLLCFAGHKGPLGPHGIGGLWAAPNVAFESPWAVCEVGEGRGACSPFPGYCDVGSVNLAAAAGLAVALDWRREHGGAAWARALELARELREALARRGHVYGGDGPHTATLSVRLDALPLARAEPHFAGAGIAVRAGQHCAPLALEALGTPEGTLRISLGPFNRDEDVAAIVDAVDRL